MHCRRLLELVENGYLCRVGEAVVATVMVLPMWLPTKKLLGSKRLRGWFGLILAELVAASKVPSFL